MEGIVQKHLPFKIKALRECSFSANISQASLRGDLLSGGCREAWTGAVSPVCLSVSSATIPDARADRAQPRLDRQLLKPLVTTRDRLVEKLCGRGGRPETERTEDRTLSAPHTIGCGKPGWVSSTTSRTKFSLGGTQSHCPSTPVAPGGTRLANYLENKCSLFELLSA